MDKGYEDLEVYQRAFALQRPILRTMRSTTSIVEGYARRRSPEEFCSFLALSVGSANEMEVQLKIARELNYISEEGSKHFIEEYQIIGKQLTRLIQYWRTKGEGEA